jgi:protein TonB
MLKAVIRVGAIVFALALSNTAQAQQVASAATPSDQTYLSFQVDRVVTIRTSVAPIYPEALRANRVEGEVLVQFVVDEKGNAQMSTFKVLKASDNAFSDAVRSAVSSTKYTPAELGGRKVKQLVQQPFRFAPSK